jgi:hypothetical protein
LQLIGLSGCGEGYELVPARLNIVDVPEDSFSPVVKTIHDALTSEGFEDLGKYEDMIALISHADDMPQKIKQEQLERLQRERTYLNRSRHLRIVLTNYTDGVPPEISLGYARLSDHFVELDVYDDRPGGFGPYGLAFYNRFLFALRQGYGRSVRVVEPPPPTNEAVYRRITTENTIAAIFGWCIAFVLPFLVTGTLSRYLLQKLKIATNLKRVIFTLINTWLVTPLPFPMAFIYIMVAPNLFAFPWTTIDYYSRVTAYAAVSFPVTLTLCAIASVFLLRDKRDAEVPRNEAPA